MIKLFVAACVGFAQMLVVHAAGLHVGLEHMQSMSYLEHTIEAAFYAVLHLAWYEKFYG